MDKTSNTDIMSSINTEDVDVDVSETESEMAEQNHLEARVRALQKQCEIKDQQIRVLQQGARNGNPLALATAEACSPFSQTGSVALW